MKCPKCGYISFDYNQLCPKCSKNISAELEKFNLPTFRPDPPALLGFLIGEANESNVNLRVPTGSHIATGTGDRTGLTDSIALDQDTVDVEDQDLDVTFPPEETEEDLFEHEFQTGADKILSDADFHLEKKVGDEDLISGEDDLSLNLGDFSLEEPEEELHELMDEGAEQGIVPDDVSLKSAESPSAETGLDEIESEIELDLDDLKVDDMGDLEINTDVEASLMELGSTLVESEEEAPESKIELSDEEQLPDISELILEEAKAGTNEQIMIADELTPEGSGSPEEGELVLDEIDLEDFDLGEEELLGAEEESPSDAEKTILLEDLDINDSGELEKSFDFSQMSIDKGSAEDISEEDSKDSLADTEGLEDELEAMELDVDEYQKKGDSGDFNLDLEDMDIDLDLNEPKK
ncbi:MAG: hypothetical protein JW944_10450 [Deltaproteobacteria bacterium]|nr:hypothetical protein [Deltaproteobacteria bacterium]